MKHFHRYLPLSDEARDRGMYFIAGGYTMIPPGLNYPPLPHPEDHDFRWDQGRTLHEYQLIYITRGEGLFESQSGGRRAISAGTLFALFPGEWHRYSPNGDTGWDEYWVAFDGSFAAHVMSEAGLSPESPMLVCDVDERMVEEFLRIADEMRAEAAGHQFIMAARTVLILALACAAAPRRALESSDAGRVLERAKCLLLEHINEPVNMENLAAQLNVGYSWFRRAFRAHTGLSPAQYHMQLRLNRARELLRDTTLPVAVISQRLGFESPEYFARIFKQKCGCTPREHRAETQTPKAQM